jgi:hypothetical protein
MRNKVNAGELMPACQETVRSVVSMVYDIQMSSAQASTSPASLIQRWSPPPPDHLKINVDATFRKETKAGAWGFIICDHEGATVLAGVGNLGPVHDALFAETMACKQALEAAEHFGISHVMIETDSSQLKDVITSSSRDLAIGGGLFADIRSLLHDSFNCINVCKIPRSCNSSAHELASLDMSWDPG